MTYTKKIRPLRFCPVKIDNMWRIGQVNTQGFVTQIFRSLQYKKHSEALFDAQRKNTIAANDERKGIQGVYSKSSFSDVLPIIKIDKGDLPHGFDKTIIFRCDIT